MEEMLRTVEDIMSGVALFQPCDTPILEVLELLHRNNADAVIVMHNGIPKGIITESEIVVSIASAKQLFYNMKAGEVMRAPLESISHNTNIVAARDFMANVNLGKLPVKKDDEIIGLITQRDILNYIF
ncbi:CBS domain-containing protein [Candidatus Woesearchaeota archaeon]|nr:CBS domain-containing protein [Candidatus Woesearchaeota archaeon]